MSVRTRSSLAFTLCVALLGLNAGCTNLPFLKGVLSASPTPAVSETPAASAEPEEQVIEGHVGNATPTPAVSSTPTAAPMTATVHLVGMAFSPSQVTIGKGGAVTFINDDAMPHSVVPRSGAQFTGSAIFNQGQQVSITFDQAGAQPYVCGVHPSMTGTVTVQAP